MILLFAAASVVFLGYTSLNIRRSVTDYVKATGEKYRETKASSLAESGVDYALNALAADTTWTGVQRKQLKDGVMDISAVTTNRLYPGGAATSETGKFITSIGTFEGVTDTIKFIVHFPPKFIPPPSFTPPLCAKGNLNLGGGMYVHTEHDKPVNANVHTNSDLEVKGGYVKGYATYSGTSNLSEAEESTYFDPYNTIPGQSLARKIDPIEFPNYDVTALASEATVTLSGKQSFSGNTTLGTEDNPQVYFIDGDLDISGHISGYGCFIVTGSIDVTGNVTIDAVSGSSDNKNRLGLYAGTDVKVAGGAEVHAQMYADGYVRFQGNSELYGLAAASGGIKCGGTINVHYRPKSDNIIPENWYVERAGVPYIVSYLD